MNPRRQHHILSNALARAALQVSACEVKTSQSHREIETRYNQAQRELDDHWASITNVPHPQAWIMRCVLIGASIFLATGCLAIALGWQP